MPDPNRRWADMQGINNPPFAGIDVTQQMCPFVNRCPDAIDSCIQEVPSSYALDPTRIAKCFLYEHAGTVPDQNIATYFNLRGSMSSNNGSDSN